MRPSISPFAVARCIPLNVAAVAAFLAFAGVASAQPPPGDRPHVAIGGGGGGSIPLGRRLDNSPLVAATFEVLATRSISVRAEIGAAWAQVDRRGFEHDIRPAFADLDVVYRWQLDPWQPYFEIGAGLYRFTSSVKADTLRDGAIRDELIALGFDPGSGTATVRQTDTAFGANAGFGIEYSLARRATVFADLRYHEVGHVTAIASFDGSLVGFSVGAKMYF